MNQTVWFERVVSCSEGNDDAKLSDERRTFNTSATEKTRKLTGIIRGCGLSPPARTLGAGLDGAMAALNMEKYDVEDDAHAGRQDFWCRSYYILCEQ